MTYEKILEIADKKPLTIRQHEKFFKPVLKDDDTILFDYAEEATYQANIFAHALGTKPYQHIWTVLNYNSSNFLLLSGIHYHNSIGYIVCETPVKIDNPSWTIEAIYRIYNK